MPASDTPASTEISSVADRGRFGLTAIADTAEEADALYKRTVQIFDDEARKALGKDA